MTVTEEDETRTAIRTCPLCEAGCGLEISVVDGQVGRIRGDRADVFSRGYICPKGSTLKQLHDDPDRLRVPLIKEGILVGRLQEMLTPLLGRPDGRPSEPPRTGDNPQ